MTDTSDPITSHPMYDTPPLDPGVEPRLHEPAFDAECVAFCQGFLLEGQSLCSEHIVTQTEKWGLVWRADYKRPGSEFPDRGDILIHFICWFDGPNSDEDRATMAVVDQGECTLVLG